MFEMPMPDNSSFIRCPLFCLRTLAGLLLVICALTYAAPSFAADTAEKAEDIRTHVREVLQGAAPGAVTKLYAATNYAPLWFSNSAPMSSRQALLTEIERRAFYGLPPDPACSNAGSESGAPSAAATAEIALTICFLRLHAAIAHGTVPQDQMGQWHLTGETMPVTEGDIADIRNGRVRDVLMRARPSSKDYAALEAALAVYVGFAGNGGWQPLPGTEEVLFDGTDARVENLKQRLAAEAYLSKSGEVTTEDVHRAVRRFQADRGLVPDGRVGRRTLAALNVPVAERIAQIAVNMERWRHMPRSFGDSYVAVNVADAMLAVWQNAQAAIRMRTIIGEVKHQTPTFQAEITGVTINPPWTIPASIAAKEILPKLKRNPNYLAENEITILNRAEDPFGLNVRWDNVSALRFPYQLRQRPGSKNPLGLIKVEMSNPFDVYLHDTPARSLFALPQRGLSHGCVRVEEPETLALHLLPNQTLDQIKLAIAAGTTKTLPLARPLPVYILYFTAFSGENGALQFRDDLYSRDLPIARALDLHGTAAPVGDDLFGQDGCPLVP
jgi:murein L,D-transpeptidase YcbB/YkuD